MEIAEIEEEVAVEEEEVDGKRSFIICIYLYGVDIITIYGRFGGNKLSFANLYFHFINKIGLIIAWVEICGLRFAFCVFSKKNKNDIYSDGTSTESLHLDFCFGKKKQMNLLKHLRIMWRPKMAIKSKCNDRFSCFPSAIDSAAVREIEDAVTEATHVVAVLLQNLVPGLIVFIVFVE